MSYLLGVRKHRSLVGVSWRHGDEQPAPRSLRLAAAGLFSRDRNVLLSYYLKPISGRHNVLRHPNYQRRAAGLLAALRPGAAPKEGPSPRLIGAINILRMIKIRDGHHWHREEKSQH